MRKALFFCVGAVVVYGLIYTDVVMRAKEATSEGDKYFEWYQHPDQKKKYFEDEFESRKKALEKERDKKKMSDDDFNAKLESLTYERDFNLDESSLKYAYQWYKDAYELFSPPESKWVREARLKAPQVLELWKQELRSKKIPFEDYMFE